MSNLVKIGPEAVQQFQQGGMGLDFGSKLFQLKPATININQPNTQVEGAIPGKLRISETGDQFDFMDLILLQMPDEKRDYYVGEPGQLNRSSENLMCFSHHVERDRAGRETQGPDPKAKVPQAMKCSNCPQASWEKWRQDSRPAAAKKELIPPCDLYYFGLFIDTRYKLPLKMYIRSKGKQPFEQGMQELARKFKLMQSEGLNPNIFDIRFRLSTKSEANGKFKSYVPVFSDFKRITEEERDEFGAIFLEFTGRNRKQADAEAEAAADVETTVATIDAQVVEPGTESGNVIDGEIMI